MTDRPDHLDPPAPDDPIARRLARSWDVVVGEITAPRPSRLERLLIRCAVPEPTARLVAATPALRWSWVASVAIVLWFAAVAGAEQWAPGDQLAVFLAIAPAIPVIGVAFAYGPRADRAHEVFVAAPISGLRLLLVRSVTVFVAAGLLAALGALSSPTTGWWRVAWVLPALATTTGALALGTALGVRRACGTVAVGWLAVVATVAQAVDDATAAFGVTGQVTSLVATTVAAFVLLARRRRLDRWDAR